MKIGKEDNNLGGLSEVSRKSPAALVKNLKQGSLLIWNWEEIPSSFYIPQIKLNQKLSFSLLPAFSESELTNVLFSSVKCSFIVICWIILIFMAAKNTKSKRALI
jgi:hypothetical protein